MRLIARPKAPPLPVADRIQIALAETDLWFHECYGRDDSTWAAWQWREYRRSIDAVWARQLKGRVA